MRQWSELGEIPDPAPTSVAAGEGSRRILDAVSRERAPTRSDHGRRRAFSLGLSAIWVLGLVVIFGVRSDSATLPGWYVTSWFGAPLVLALAALGSAKRTGNTGLGLGLNALVAVALGAPLALALVALGLPPPRVVAPDAANLKNAIVCFESCLLFGMVPFVLAAMAFRRAFPALGTWRGALCGAAAGSFAAAALNAHCPNVSPVHLVLGHVLPVVLLTALGALAGKRVMRA